MIRTLIVPLLAIAGVIVAVYTVVQGSKPPVALPPANPPPSAPYESFVAGSGLVEASSQNIAIGTPVGGLVAHVGVQVGDDVEKGQPLFTLDDRQPRAELAVREATLGVAKAQLERLRQGTRPEEIAPARARLAEADAQLADLRDQLAKWERVTDNRAVSEDELSRKRFAVRTAEARAAETTAALALLEAGTWSPDIKVAQSQVAAADAQAQSTRVEIERLVVRAPVAGKVLQLNVRPGEFAQPGPLQTPLVVLGAVNPLHVRVDVDEHDAWRVKANADAVAFVRGNKDISATLRFVRFEPYVVPKRSLTGDSTERVDTRVLQVIYAFDPHNLPIYVGQQMDVYIQTDPGAKPPAPGNAAPGNAAK